MPDIAPFRGLRYDAAKVGDISMVVTPPYDVISPEARDAYHDRHPHSAIRLDLGKGPTEGAEETWYVQAGRTFAQWQRQGILARDPEPALYVYEQDFALGRHRLSRRGAIALVRLEPYYGQGSIFPHEHTFPRHRKDRLNLMRACPANLSHIFAIYGGPPDPIAGIQNVAADGPPAVQAVDDEGFHHRVWVLTDRGAVARIAEALRGRPAVIADGHHRYETALAYRDECLALDADPPEVRQRKTYNYATMMLVSARDPGLVILATHRLVRTIPYESTDRLLQDVRRFFAVEPRDLPAGAEVDGVRACLQEMARRGRGEQAFGLFAGGKEFYLLNPKETARAAAAAQTDAATARVDTGLLHAVLFREVLRIPADREGAEVGYTQDEAAAFAQVASGAARLAVFLNPTPMEQVEAVATTGRRLPPKSTYFYPKLLTGLVFHRIDLAEVAAAPAAA